MNHHERFQMALMIALSPIKNKVVSIHQIVNLLLDS
jgi:hypothetical protein